SNEEITDTNFATIENYLSSGTAKGVTLYGNILYALRTGGIIFIDELENHFNHAIVRTFIEYFVNNRINKNNATIIFSTHYSELLDDFERGDEI
ncbi:AAA family ATPase, partial [Lactobacillus salivarius]|nr:AAA family ATPase [Ligilactobacillus salivarius]